jgi:hypothetical protein
MNACFCRLAYSMRCVREQIPGTPSSVARGRKDVKNAYVPVRFEAEQSRAIARAMDVFVGG